MIFWVRRQCCYFKLLYLSIALYRNNDCCGGKQNVYSSYQWIIWKQNKTKSQEFIRSAFHYVGVWADRINSFAVWIITRHADQVLKMAHSHGCPFPHSFNSGKNIQWCVDCFTHAHGWNIYPLEKWGLPRHHLPLVTSNLFVSTATLSSAPFSVSTVRVDVTVTWHPGYPG